MAKRTHLARDEESSGVHIARSRGSYLFDKRGRKYVDFLAGWCVGNFGWNNFHLVRARRSFNGPDYVYPGDSYAPWEELAVLLARIAPAELTMCYRATGGSEAVDIALQAAMATGFGRTGRLFGSELYNIEPDIMTLGKAITGGVAGMGAVISTDEIAASMEKEGTFYSTYGWHRLSTHVAIANVRWIIQNERRLLDGVAATSAYATASEGYFLPETINTSAGKLTPAPFI